MSRAYSTFPPGAAGIALVLLRLALAATLLADLRLMPVSVSLAATALAVGFLTPIPAPFCCGFEGSRFFVGEGPGTIFLIAAMLNAVALALLGPGAYSLDARWFGRRVIVFPPNEKPRFR